MIARIDHGEHMEADRHGAMPFIDLCILMSAYFILPVNDFFVPRAVVGDP